MRVSKKNHPFREFFTEANFGMFTGTNWYAASGTGYRDIYIPVPPCTNVPALPPLELLVLYH